MCVIDEGWVTVCGDTPVVTVGGCVQLVNLPSVISFFRVEKNDTGCVLCGLGESEGLFWGTWEPAKTYMKRVPSVACILAI